jgi:hypothetical protein
MTQSVIFVLMIIVIIIGLAVIIIMQVRTISRIIPPTECEPIIDAAKDTFILSNMNRKGTSSPLDLNNWLGAPRQGKGMIG